MGLLLLLLGIVTVVVFQPVFKAPLALDDQITLTHIRQFESWHQVWKADAFHFFRPVKNLFFYLVEQSGGGATRYHWINLGAYFVAACAAFTLGLRLSGRLATAFAAAAIWLLSPTGGTNAVWATCFNINVAAASMAFCVACYDIARDESRHSRIWGAAAAAFFVFGLLSYETAVATPALLVLVDVYRGRKLWSKPSLIRYASMALAIVAWLACRHWVGAAGVQQTNPSLDPAMPAWQLTASAPYFLWTHIKMWALPSGRLEMLGSYLWDRSIPAAMLPFLWVLFLGLVYLGIRHWKRAPLFFFGLAWFVTAAAPSGNFLPLGNTPAADYYVPIPAIGLSLSLAAILQMAATRLRGTALAEHRSATLAAMATMVCICGWRLAQIPVLTGWLTAWQNPAQVMALTAAARPHQFYAHAATAYYLAYDEGAKDEQILQTIESSALAAEKDMPDLGLAQSALGEVARRRGDRNLAAALFEKSIGARHPSTDTLLWSRKQLVLTLSDDPSQFDRAFPHLLVLLQHRGRRDHPQCVLLAAKLMRGAGKRDEELRTLEKGHLYHPANAEILSELENARSRAAEQSS
ncbi:hypothetical protein OKA05_16450 [Luteolibacter arcticus]|uniref:Tetratricopeptide repeat protein n=1 Tax=Luteolibacter arcticus TaxID=1581411 RepID=A0ABT3GKV5_9BACT|nr:hypothetical protein [Luteolibacter arcticus]MCW1924159.1 hypothetical protein [Luteolibacter arcticus]